MSRVRLFSNDNIRSPGPKRLKSFQQSQLEQCLLLWHSDIMCHKVAIFDEIIMAQAKV